MFRNKMLPNVIAGFIAVLLGVVSILEAVRLYPMKMSVMVGDHSMPALLGLAMIVLGLLLVFLPKNEAFRPEFPEKDTMRVLIAILAVMFGYWIVMKYLGYLLSTLIASLMLFRITGSYSWMKSALIASVTTAVIYLIFVLWLNMMLPEGFLKI